MGSHDEVSRLHEAALVIGSLTRSRGQVTGRVRKRADVAFVLELGRRPGLAAGHTGAAGRYDSPRAGPRRPSPARWASFHEGNILQLGVFYATFGIFKADWVS